MVTVLAILKSGRSDAGNFILFDKKLLIIIAQGEKAEGLSTHPFDNSCTERESGFPHSRTADIKV